MSDMMQLIETANRLSDRLSDMATEEKRFGFEICHLLEQISYDVFKTANELKEINQYVAGASYDARWY